MNRQRGFSLIEIVVATSITLAVILPLMNTFTNAFKYASNNLARVQASFLEEEGVEAVRLIRDNGWSTNIAPLTRNTPYYLTFNGTSWVTTTTPNSIDSTFTRTVTLSNVYRDGSQNIASSGTLDTNAVIATVAVAWNENGTPRTQELTALFTNIFAN